MRNTIRHRCNNQYQIGEVWFHDTELLVLAADLTEYVNNTFGLSIWLPNKVKAKVVGCRREYVNDNHYIPHSFYVREGFVCRGIYELVGVYDYDTLKGCHSVLYSYSKIGLITLARAVADYVTRHDVLHNRKQSTGR